jgi:hypothetical protein
MAIKVNWNKIDLKHPSFFHTDSTWSLLEEMLLVILAKQAFWYSCHITEVSTLGVECVLGDLEKLENKQLDCYELFDSVGQINRFLNEICESKFFFLRFLKKTLFLF